MGYQIRANEEPPPLFPMDQARPRGHPGVRGGTNMTDLATLLESSNRLARLTVGELVADIGRANEAMERLRDENALLKARVRILELKLQRART